MTFILGSRCADGVVLIADKKVTIGDSSEPYYQNKLFWDIGHVIFGAAGSAGLYELYTGYAVDYINTHLGEVTYENARFKLAQFASDLYKKLNFNPDSYNILVAIQPPDRASNLTLISGNGLPCKIEGCVAIGSGRTYSTVFLKRIWHENMTMEKVAELGYFIIKYIEDFELNSTVGVNGSYPQIFFVPDNEKDERGEKKNHLVNPDIRPEQFERIKNNAIKRFKKHTRQLNNLFRD